MDSRPRDLQNFLDRSHEAMAARLQPGSEAARVAQTIAAALAKPAVQSERQSSRLPVCKHLGNAFDLARQQGPEAAGLADALAQIEPQLTWRRRWNANPTDAGFYDGHANANIVGPEGLEKRDDIWIGVSLMAPNVRYPDHHHPPPEIYVSLSPGEWRQADLPWFEPGIGGLVYNQSDIIHAMRSGSSPLLAVWSLWVESRV
jgi:hypothetical protein